MQFKLLLSRDYGTQIYGIKLKGVEEMLNQVVRLIALLLITINTCNLVSLAQTQVAPKVVAPVQPTSAPSPQPAEKEVDLKTKTAPTEKKVALCPCLDPIIIAIQKAYNSLEEDEWPTAIKISTDTLNTITSISKTCKCTEVTDYQNVAMAYLNYSKAGNLLDGEDEPDCKVAKKLYEDAIGWLETSISKITNSEVSGNARSIQEYAKEELQFVKDECQESQSPAKSPPQKPPSSSKQ